MPSYKKAVEWIATQDEPAEENVGEVASLISVCLVADLWGKGETTVAVDVLAYRRKRREIEAKRVEKLRQRDAA